MKLHLIIVLVLIQLLNLKYYNITRGYIVMTLVTITKNILILKAHYHEQKIFIT